MAVAGCAAWALGSGLSLSQMFHGGLAIATAWFAGERTRLRREQLARARGTRAPGRARGGERAPARGRRGARPHRPRPARLGRARDQRDRRPRRRGPAARRAERSETLETIETIARDTVGELDRTCSGVARRATRRPHRPAWRRSTRCSRTTPRAASTSRCARPGPRARLAGSVDQAAYRILQEALTNAARHGTGTARVELAFRDAGIELTVINPVPAAARTRGTGGHGLHRHARARCAHRRGAARSRGSTGSFRVHAELPYAMPTAS